MSVSSSVIKSAAHLFSGHLQDAKETWMFLWLLKYCMLVVCRIFIAIARRNLTSRRVVDLKSHT